jgi:hypothetical protein
MQTHKNQRHHIVCYIHIICTIYVKLTGYLHTYTLNLTKSRTYFIQGVLSWSIHLFICCIILSFSHYHDHIIHAEDSKAVQNFWVCSCTTVLYKYLKSLKHDHHILYMENSIIALCLIILLVSSNSSYITSELLHIRFI